MTEWRFDMIMITLQPEHLAEEPTLLSIREEAPLFTTQPDPETGRQGSKPIGHTRGRTAHVGSFTLTHEGAAYLLRTISHYLKDEGETKSVGDTDVWYTDQIPSLIIEFRWPQPESKPKDDRTWRRFAIAAEILNDGTGVPADKLSGHLFQFISLDNTEWEAPNFIQKG